MAKRKQNDFLPDEEESAPFYKKLLKYRDEVTRKKQAREEKANGEMGAMGFWSAVAGLAFVTDFTLTGGVLTVFAGAAGLEWIHHQHQASKAGKELKEIDEKLFKIETEQLSRNPSPELKAGLRQEFARSQDEMDALRRQVEALQKELDQVKNPKTTTFRKPNFDPPRK